MRDLLIELDRDSPKSLQSQLREVLVSAILAGHLKPTDKLPSTRHLSRQLRISRNTSVLVYQGLVEDGYLRTSQRSGYYVNETVLEMGVHRSARSIDEALEAPTETIDWAARMKKFPGGQANISKPKDWRKLPFPFIYGQPDQKLFPITDWRDCVYKSMSKQWLDAWTQDTQNDDDQMLVEQIRTRILPRRGILVGEDQILVTLGAQQSLYTAASLLVDSHTRVALENPGYPDARNIFALRTDRITPQPVDRDGLIVGENLRDIDILYTTPSHQLPTNVTMSPQRRRALLERSREEDFLIIEDDYELETNYVGEPLPALKSSDRDGRVIYVGSFSKTLFPGLRLGFVVADAPLIAEMRALRRLMVRHPPMNNQRSTAFFLSLGHYDVFVRRLHRTYHQRWKTMGEALAKHLPQATVSRGQGGSSYWVELPEGSTAPADQIAKAALAEGILIEPGKVYFTGPCGEYSFRLGFSSIEDDVIETGIERLAHVIAQHSVN
ncbi:PLP-dependent aminotransferase family protein [Ahrensia sp. R2A130]|uniref:MocR-like pyridoxine biosynthesis transcription factor PdxR n=1 Tax=Ahrensia sp. R2A130 TaxID=744979 RepID=UPI0001E0A433|nr:PLP-dependent aminotransferase family protein [Ahrensia sp. R2A130]EFL90087.1 MocR family transcriptional regulator [Ahrensia sp. R2A130]